METLLSIANGKHFLPRTTHEIATWEQTLHPLLPAMDEAEINP